MNEQELIQFVQWLPSSIDEFKDKTPDEVVTILNKLSQTEEGMKTISGLINQFKQNTSMFKNGGKLGQLINKFQQGGKSDQRKSDKVRKDFHGISLFEYGPNRYRTARGTLARDLKPGVHQETLPNGIGLRQITRNNITTTELVSPDKRDTLYIHNGRDGRVDSNIDDSGILGMLGLKQPTPVSGRFRYLQNRFNTQKFEDGGEVFEEFKVIPADTTNNVVTQRILYRRTPESMQTEITRKYPVNKPDESSYTKRMHSTEVGMKGTKEYDWNFTNDFFARLLGQKPPKEMVSMFMEQYPDSFK